MISLYNFKEDISQQNNLAESNPNKLKELIDVFETLRGKGFAKIEQLELH